MSTLSTGLLIQDPRLEDYLNDKFQSLVDLDNVDSLLSSVQSQQNILRQQLETAEATLETTQSEYDRHITELELETRQFHEDQALIDRRIEATHSSEATNAVSQAFELSLSKLQRLDIAQEYLKILSDVYNLKEEINAKLDVSAEEAAKPYNRLQCIATALRERNEKAEGTIIHLVDFVKEVETAAWKEMHQRLSGKFKAVLDKLRWPSAELTLKESRREFEDAFAALLVVEEPVKDEGPRMGGKPKTLELYPFQAILPFRDLVRPLELRFRFHFDGDKATNKPDKPEWFLNHIVNLVAQYAPFLVENVQPILDRAPGKSRDAVQEFISALLPVVRRKITHLLPNIAQNAQLLSHFIHELVKFDITLKEEYLYAPFGFSGDWGGLTSEVLNLDGDGGFTQWLAVERDFAYNRFREIIHAPDAWTLDYESVSASETKPTKSAIRLRELLENITETYRPLPAFHQQLRFLLDVQVTLLDQYHSRLHDSVEAFKVLTSSIARAVQGTSKEELAELEGVKGLERLCRVVGSTMFLENAMRDWGEDALFLEIWDQIISKASKTSDSDAKVAGDFTIDDLASVTSATLTTGERDGALFDESATAYRTLRERVEQMISSFVSGAVKNEMGDYLKLTIWQQTEESTPPANVHAITPSSELQPALQTLQTYLAFLQPVLSPVVMRRTIREVAASIQQYIWDYVLMRHQFRIEGALQLQRDIMEFEGQFSDFLIPGGSNAYAYEEDGGNHVVLMKKLHEAGRLLTLTDTDEEIGADATNGELVTLKEVVHPLFADNERGRDVVKSLKLSELGVGGARSVLQRRVEAWD
ncbi:hypothetical protein BJ508DRAFT_413240 [Ascobolus immersus RN42]|uniref:RINT-1 family protein n=1 Tax=Ascobolus immersus RN42 TaxID=1160509 RepID=A0A3N4IBV6_ASCIM|nr:hypothetical protein BJ508DRAFT_413240 [Ascobolus immersus RN42]